MHKIVICLALLGIAPISPANGQNIVNAFSNVPRIETDSGRGSGFVVDVGAGKTEVWTNGHVVDRVGQEVTLRFAADTPNESTAKGTVAWRRFEEGIDAAKIIIEAEIDVQPFRIRVGSNGDDVITDLVATAGYPLGNRGYSVILSEYPKRDFNRVKAYLPSAIPGQSGSPIVNGAGEVTHVVTLYAKVGREKFGGAMPISDWTEGDTTTVATLGPEGLGHFQLLPNP